MLHTVDGFCKPEAVAVVGVGGGQVFGGVRGTCQSASVRPCEGCAVVPGGGVADGVVADGVSVVGLQQIKPLAVHVGEDLRLGAVPAAVKAVLGGGPVAETVWVRRKASGSKSKRALYCPADIDIICGVSNILTATVQ